MLYKYTMAYHWAIKKNGIMLFALKMGGVGDHYIE
jgi:hypothetical protein